MQLIEKQPEFVSRFSRWNGDESLRGYPFVENVHAPFTPVKRALPMMNLALISSAGAYIDGTEPFDLDSRVPVLLAISGVLAFVRLGLHLVVAYLPSRMAGDTAHAIGEN